MTESPLVDSGFVVPVFSPRDDPIACLNKAMAFLTAVASSSYSGTGYKSNATSSEGNNSNGQARVVKCYNCQGEGHMDRQCTQPKRPRNAAWYKDKAILAEAQEARKILAEEQLAFLIDPWVLNGQAIQTIILNNAAFYTEDLNTYDSNCDDISNTKAMLMANISKYDYDVLRAVDFTDNEIHSDSNIIPYSQYLQETQQANVQDTHLQAQQDSMILSMIEQMSTQIINHETLILEEESRSRMSKKEKDPEAIKQNISHKPIDYEKLNRLTKDFRQRFTPCQEWSAEQAF
nr:hypothetical protein [Tanacetum cinerariifolium]